MFRKAIIVAAALVVTTASAYADWMVIRPDAGACFVTESMAEGGQTQMGPAYATEAEATTAMASIPECQAVNTDPDPDEND
jgi:hypothetical protein